MNDQRPRHGLPFAITPLYPGRALVLFALLYVCSAVAWANFADSVRSDIKTYWLAFFALGLPVVLVVLRMLWLLLVDGWFVAAIFASFAGVVAVASAKLPLDAAYSNVYRTFPFVALGAVLACASAASALYLPWKRSRLPRLVFHAGTIIALAGAFTSIAGRTSGSLTLSKGRPESLLILEDRVLTVVTQDGRWTRIRIPWGKTAPAPGQTLDASIGALRLQIQDDSSGGGPGPSALRLTVTDGADAALRGNARQGGQASLPSAGKHVFKVLFDAGFAPMEIGGKTHRVAFGPATVELPFEVSLEYAGDDYIAPSASAAAPDASISLAYPSGARVETADLKIGVPLTLAGYRVTLLSVERPTKVIVSFSRNPGMTTLLVGLIVLAAGALLAARDRLLRKR